MNVSRAKRARFECRTTREKVFAERLLANGNKNNDFKNASIFQIDLFLSCIKTFGKKTPDLHYEDLYIIYTVLRKRYLELFSEESNARLE